MVKKASSRQFASQPRSTHVRSEMTYSCDDCNEREHCKERKPKSQRQQVMNDEPDKCQPHQSCQQLALKLPVLHEQNNQAKLRNYHQKLRYFGDVLSDRFSARRRFGSRQSEFKSSVGGLDFSSFHKK